MALGSQTKPSGAEDRVRAAGRVMVSVIVVGSFGLRSVIAVAAIRSRHCAEIYILVRKFLRR